MLGIFLNTSHDIELNADGSLKMASDGEKVAQDLRTRLKTFRSEVLLDNNYGFPYEVILGSKRTNLSELELLIRQYILETDGVLLLEKFNLGYVGENRKLTISFSITSIYSTSSISIDNIFIG